MQIRLDKVHLQIISNSSCINWGNNLHVKTSSIIKSNQGCGTISGDDNILTIGANTIDDSDITDTDITSDLSTSVKKDITLRT